MPWNMREYLQDVQVPDPAGGGGLVPLAGPPQRLAERVGPPTITGRDQYSWWIWSIFAGVARAVGLFVQQPWVLPVASLVCGVSLWWALRPSER